MGVAWQFCQEIPDARVGPARIVTATGTGYTGSYADTKSDMAQGQTTNARVLIVDDHTEVREGTGLCATT